MATFKDLAEVFDPDLYLPINGKTYRVPAPDAGAGLRLFGLYRLGATAAFGGSLTKEQIGELELNDTDEQKFFRDALGGAYPEMKDDGVSLEYIRHAASTAFMRWTVGEDTALAFWEQDAESAGKAVAVQPTTETPAGTAGESSPTESPTGTSDPAQSTTEPGDDKG